MGIFDNLKNIPALQERAQIAIDIMAEGAWGPEAITMLIDEFTGTTRTQWESAARKARDAVELLGGREAAREFVLQEAVNLMRETTHYGHKARFLEIYAKAAGCNEKHVVIDDVRGMTDAQIDGELEKVRVERLETTQH